MKCKMFRICNCLLVAGLIAFASQFAQGAASPPLSGSYQVLQKIDRGPQSRVRLQIHLTNHGPRDLHIQRLTLWDFSHPDKGATCACPLVVRSRTSADMTQEFTIRRPEYELWKRGTQPRLVIEVQMPDGHRTTQAVRLERVFGRRAN
jgi:hypothetical protein